MKNLSKHFGHLPSNLLDLTFDTRLWWSSGKVSDAGFQVRNPIPRKSRRVLGLLHVKSNVGEQTFSGLCGAKVWRGGPDQVLSSTSDRGSKFRGLSQNSPRVASKQDDNKTKLISLRCN
ncbi:hypothetical protein AVEN_33105-1 [Araneus ventricosus]|uniref:Uncharacterized protein n=1 Tax=Araneus ventricosus TaxID=182803 RepID=A0A4Y2CWZ9_ARAVE|nr:hypothetical protein AVEN_33105-1 [Araneus ventricosus]